jgi:hypothetical protein
MSQFIFTQFKELDEQIGMLISRNHFAVLSDLSKVMQPRKIFDGYWVRLSTKGDFELCDYGRGLYAVKISVNGYGAGLVNDSPKIQYCVNFHVGNIDDMSWDATSPYTESRADCVKLAEEMAPVILKQLNVMPTSDILNEMLRPYGMYGTLNG